MMRMQPLLLVSLQVLTLEAVAAFSSTRPADDGLLAYGVDRSSSVIVWDNVIPSSDARTKLHQAASQAGLSHRVFERSLLLRRDDDNSIAYIENVLDSILTQLGDTGSKYVEYWTRQEWRSIEAHADIDEFLAKHKQQDFRYPDHGHVLYLKVGAKVRGPTCVFPNRRSGGDLLHKNQHDPVDLITVPAVPGRLLRFAGHSLHAVPRPTDHWLLKFVRGAPQFEPESEWGRSVILFNTWKEKPPLGVELTTTSPVSNNMIAGGGEALNDGCAARGDWKPQSTGDEEADAAAACTTEGNIVPAKIWLLGDAPRRGHAMRTVTLNAKEAELREALYQPSKVSRVALYQQ